MRHCIYLLFAAIAIIAAPLDGSAAKPRKSASTSAPKKVVTQAPRGINAVRNEQRNINRDIKRTNDRLEANKRNTARSLMRLESLGAEITSRTRTISQVEAQLDTINHRVTTLTDSVATLEAQLKAMRESYARTVRRIRTHRRSAESELAFIFSAENVNQAWRRRRYLSEVAAWRDRRRDELTAHSDSLRARRTQLADMQSRKTGALNTLTAERSALDSRRKETSALVDRLKKENVSLQAVLREKEARARALDNELDRLIEQQRREAERREREAEEARRRATAARPKTTQTPKPSEKSTEKAPSKPTQEAPVPNAEEPSTPAKEEARTYATADETRSLSGSFESNKGRLLFPVAGNYRIVRPFGRSQHPELRHVTIDNSGIDIEVAAGTSARAVFAGKVSAIFRQPGYNNIVMLRHGSYLTIYAGLSSINVRNGQEVQQGTSLGTVYADPENNGRALLHFELRRETAKLNPSAWVR